MQLRDRAPLSSILSTSPPNKEIRPLSSFELIFSGALSQCSRAGYCSRQHQVLTLEAVGQQEFLFTADWNAEGTATWEDSLVTSYKAKRDRTIGANNGAPWSLPTELETYVYTKTCIRVFIAA